MSYRPPDFNLLANLWLCDGEIAPVNGPPDVTDVPCQKYIASRSAWAVTPPWSTGFYLAYAPPVQLRFPRQDQFAAAWTLWKIVCAEVPAGSGQYYRCFWQDVQHEGFINEYALVVAVQCNAELKAVPPPGGAEDTGVGVDSCGSTPPADPVPPTLPPGPWTPPGSVPVGLTDTFFDVGNTPIASHTADTGQSWSLGTGDLEIEGTGVGVIAMDTTPGQHWATVAYSGPNTYDYHVEITTPSDLSNGVYFGAIYRATDSNNWWACLCEYDGVSQWALSFYNCVAGTPTVVQTGPFSITLSPNSSYDLQLQFFGAITRANLVFLGATIATQDYNNSVDIANTQVGIWCYCDSTHPTPLFSKVDRP